MNAELPDEEIAKVWALAEGAANDGDHYKLVSVLKRLDELGERGVAARIGEFYEMGGIGIEKDIKQAVWWYERAVARRHDPIAHLGLGRLYYEGVCVPQDLKKARSHLVRAMANGIPQAGIYLGLMSMTGTGAERDLEEADRMFSFAAIQGFPIGYRYQALLAIDAAKPGRAIWMFLRELILTTRLRILDLNHPNIWKLPKG
jgi:TPR repeat protein